MTWRLLGVSALAALFFGFGGTGAGADKVSNTVSNMIQSELGVYVYPKGDQDASAQANDSLECYDSAKARTGIDPKAPAPAVAPPQATGGVQ